MSRASRNTQVRNNGTLIRKSLSLETIKTIISCSHSLFPPVIRFLDDVFCRLLDTISETAQAQQHLGWLQKARHQSACTQAGGTISAPPHSRLVTKHSHLNSVRRRRLRLLHTSLAKRIKSLFLFVSSLPLSVDNRHARLFLALPDISASLDPNTRDKNHWPEK